MQTTMTNVEQQDEHLIAMDEASRGDQIARAGI